MQNLSFKGLALACSMFASSQLALAHEIVYTAELNGPNEAPANASPATGFAKVTIDLDLVTMRVETSFQGLLGTTTAAHIHGPTALEGAGTAGVATQTPSFMGFPTGVTSGIYDNTFDLTLASSYRAQFITDSGGTVSGALNRLLQALDEGKAYLNIHTTAFTGGEIRGFLREVPDAAPSLALLAPAVLLLAGIRWSSRRN